METTSKPSPKSKYLRWFKRLLIFAIVSSIIYFCSFITAVHIVGTIDHTEEADVIIVLGAGIRRDGRPGWALTRRAEQGADLWKEGIAPVILCTGAQADGHPRSEASACKEILLREGVDESAILMEEDSRSTEENAIYSRQVMDEYGFVNAVLVSDSFHILRSEWLFREQNIITYTSPVPASRINHAWFYPYSLVREFLAFNWYVVKSALNIPVTHIYGI